MKILNTLYTNGNTKLNLDISVAPANFEPVAAGDIYWNQSDGTFNFGLYNGVTLQAGQEMYFYGKASQNILNGEVIQFAGVELEHVLMKPAVGSEIKINPSFIMGVATQDIAAGQFGYVTAFGIVHNVNTNGWAPGSILYFDCGTSLITTTIPTAPNPRIQIAAVIKAGITDGSFLVRPDFGSNLAYSNDVYLNGLNNNHILYYNTTTQRWENRELKASDVSVLDTNNYFEGATAELALSELGLVSKILKEYSSAVTGFTNNELITVTYSSTNRTITLNGTFEAYYQGKRVAALIDGWVSAPHDNIAGSYFLYYRNGSFIWSPTSWSFADLMIAYVQFGTNNFALREVHGLMAADTHEELHQTIGTYKTGGGDFTSYVLNSTTATNRRPDISTTTIKDEDLVTTVTPLLTKQYTHRYLSGLAVRTFATNQPEIIPVVGNVPYWNQNIAGTWQQTAFANQEHGAIFVVAIPTTNDAGSLVYRYLFSQPQQVGPLTTIQGLTPSNVVHGDATALVTEFVFIAKIIIQYQGGNWHIVEVSKIEGTRTNQVTSAAGVYLSSVSRDNTLSGNGTSLSPLSVVMGPGSNLDADTLDGVQATGFALSAHTHPEYASNSFAVAMAIALG